LRHVYSIELNIITVAFVAYYYCVLYL